MDPAASAFDIAEICAISNFDLKSIAKIYFAVGTRFSLKWMRSKISELNIDNHWQRLSAKVILEDLYHCQMKIAKEVVGFSCNNKEICETESLNAWNNKMQFSVERFDSFISDLKTQTNPDLAVFIVAINRLKSLVA
jgi:glutamate dehydrogenase